MKSFARRAALALWLLVLAGAAQAQITAAVAEKLMRASGQWKQLELVAPQFRAGMEQGFSAPGADVPEAARTRMLAAADAAFQVDKLRASVLRTLVEGVRAPYVAELMIWYDSPSGRRVTAVEEGPERRDESTEERAKAGMALLEAATPERRQLLLKLLETSRAGQAAADMLAQMLVGVQLGLARFDPGKSRPGEAELRSMIDAQRPQMLRAMEGLTLALFALTYRELPDEVLAAYGSFMGSAAGDHYNDISTRAFEVALQDALAALKP